MGTKTIILEGGYLPCLVVGPAQMSRKTVASISLSWKDLNVSLNR